MDHEFERESEADVRALLVAATGDGPPEHNLLEAVRGRTRRQRVRRKVGFWDPPKALALLRSAFSVREQDRVSGDGWSGRRYAFSLRDGKLDKDNPAMTGTVDVDQSGRVRRLDVTVLVETVPARGPTTSAPSWSSATTGCAKPSRPRPRPRSPMT